jgi:hypothetical protein
VRGSDGTSGGPARSDAMCTPPSPDHLAVVYGYESPRYEALGHAFAVRTTDPHLGTYLGSLFVHFAVPGPVGEVTTYAIVGTGPESDFSLRLSIGGAERSASRFAHVILRQLFWELNRAVIRDTTDHLLVHASAAEWNGSTLIFPAPMESGKSTLIAGLVRAGFGYVTDEAVAIHPDTLVVAPFPRALSLDPGSWSVLPDLEPSTDPRVRSYQGEQWQVPPDAIRPGAVAPPSRPRYVITPRYEAGAVTRLESLSTVEAAYLLGENAFNFPALGSRALSVVAAVARRSECYRLVTGDLDDACDLIRGLTHAVTSPSVPAGGGG